MTYSAAGLIQSTDLNGFVSTGSPNFNNIWSIGSGNSGWGQTAVSTVTAGTVVSFNPWNTLITNMASAAAHQGTSITAITAPVAGNTIAYLSALSTNLTSINNGRLNAAAVGTDITTSATRTANWGTAVSIPVVTSTITITFSTTDTARYFFNAGGTLRISCSRSAGTGNPQDLAWTQLCTDIGTLALPAVSTAQTIAGTSYTGFTKIGGGGTAPSIYVRNGYYNLTGTPTTYFRQFSNTGVYTGDNLSMNLSVSSNIVTISVIFTDVSSGTAADTVTGNLTVTAVARPPSTVNITNSWGTPTVAVTAPA
jgi:hypothetical protein